jgi:TrpR-related protein YerC/YecD
MNWSKTENSALVRAILTLETSDEAKRFLRDLMTETEIEEFARRFRAAGLLAANVPYSAIEKETGLSSTTIARVSKWLNGKEGGYRNVIDKLHHHDSIRLRRGLS